MSRFDDFPHCTCMRFGPFEHMALWQKRAQPIIARMIKRGRPVDLARIQETLRLVTLMETGAPECFSEENRGRSHHLKGCPSVDH